MKISPEHLLKLKTFIDTAINKYGETYLIERYQAGNFPRSEHVKELQTRFCFDLLYSVAGASEFVRAELYSYMNDAHLLTALKRVCPKVTRHY